MKEILYQIYHTLTPDELKTLTVWDLFLRATKLGNFEKWLLTLYVDLDILYRLADGQSPMFIARSMGISTKHIYKVSSYWGIFPNDVSLAYSIFSIYYDGITVEDYIKQTSKFLRKPLFKDVARKHLLNVERYLDLEGILKEYYNEYL